MSNISVKDKTNEHWYPYHSLGSYFKLENGTLMQCPMNTDGSRDDTPCDVWLDRMTKPSENDVEIYETLHGVMKELALKD